MEKISDIFEKNFALLSKVEYTFDVNFKWKPTLVFCLTVIVLAWEKKSRLNVEQERIHRNNGKKASGVKYEM